MTEHSLHAIAAAHGSSHSIFAPSASAMWLTCAGSLIPNVLAKDSAGEDAAEGTVAHALGEQWLLDGKKPSSLLGTWEWVAEGERVFEIQRTHEMFDYVEMYVDWCADLPGDHYVETRVDFSSLTPIPNQGGTADHAACTPGRLVITDLKYGKSPENIVYAKNNTQAMLYALGFLFKTDWFYDFREIVIRIAQPRLDHFDEWVVSRDELMMFAGFVKERAARAWSLNAPRTPSPYGCKWCKVKATCLAYAKLQEDLLEGVFESVAREVMPAEMGDFEQRLERDDVFASKASPNDLDTASLTTLLGYRPMAEKWWKAVEAEVVRRALDGNIDPRRKFVASRSNRVFMDAGKAKQQLLDAGLPREKIVSEKLVSPSQAEKLLREYGFGKPKIAELLQGLVLKPPGKPVLVPVEDRRPALVDISEDVFRDLSESETDETED